MINIKNEGIVLSASHYDYESKGVLNPACIEIDGIVHMFYRAISKDDISTIGYCQLKDNKVTKRFSEPLLKAEFPYEKKGLEDPRITYLDGVYYLFYTVYDGKNALVAYATATKLPDFKKCGLITPSISYEETIETMKRLDLPLKYEIFENHYQESRGEDVLLWEKDIILFPQKFGKRFGLMHRILPEIQIIFFDKFSDLTIDFWERYFLSLDRNILLKAQYWYETENIGGGCPPIKTDYGWLVIYHAVEDSSSGHVYRAGAALLDLNDPTKTIGRLTDPLFSPAFSHELNGIVNNVVFPTSAFVVGNRLHVYYGAGDKVIAMKSMNFKCLIDALLDCPPLNEASTRIEPQPNPI